MKIDMTALRGLEREKEISFDTVVGAIETALLTAYRHTEGAQPHARVELGHEPVAKPVGRYDNALRLELVQ